MTAALVGRRGRLLLAIPSRAAALRRSSARLVLALVALQAVAVVLTPAGPGEPIDGAAAAALADAVRGGGDFYGSAADLVRGEALRPTALPLPSGVPAPTLAVTLGRLGAFGRPLLLLLAAGAVAAGAARLRAGFGLTRAGAGAGAALLALGVLGALRPGVAATPEAWAGLLLLLALARTRPGRAAEPAGWALAAAVVAPAALPALGLMAAAAWRRGGRREAAALLLAAAVGLAALALHARAVAALPPATALAAPLRLGLGAGMDAVVRAGGLGLLPTLPARLLALAAAAGWAGWSARATRLPSGLLMAYAVIAGVAGERAALLVAPLLPIGLAALPDAARDAWSAALDRRRITVTRIV